jgi:hypothetical protein
MSELVDRDAERISRAVDADLALEESADLARLLSADADAHLYWRRLQALAGLLRQAFEEPELPEALANRLVAIGSPGSGASENTKVFCDESSARRLGKSDERKH